MRMADRENRYREEILSHRRSQYNEVGTPAIRLEIGNALRSAREQQGLTLEFVNSITKINIRFLEAIEEGRWNFLPPTYVKAFIKAYSSAIQDPIDNLHHRLDEMFDTAIMPYSPLRTTMEKVTPDEEEIFRGGKVSQWIGKHRVAVFWTGAGILSILAVLFFIFRPVEFPKPGNLSTLEPPGSHLRTIPSEKLASPPAPSSQELTFMKLTFSSLDTGSITVSYNDSVYYSGFQLPGSVTQVEVPAPARIDLTNPHKVDITVNGQKFILPISLQEKHSFYINSKGIAE